LASQLGGILRLRVLKVRGSRHFIDGIVGRRVWLAAVLPILVDDAVEGQGVVVVDVSAQRGG
jgi:hypothetical protein